MGELPFHTYDVFTSQLYSGNPLAIVEAADELDAARMQIIAREFNLSETIFIQQAADAANTAKVRIFFPAGEMPFAGHPTIGCAIHLAEKQNAGVENYRCRIMLEEQAGLVPVDVVRDGDDVVARLTAPGFPAAVEATLPDKPKMAAALGLEPADMGMPDHQPAVFAIGHPFLFVPLASRDALSRARPCEPQWSALTSAAGTGSVYCYCAGTGGKDADYHARMFAPAGGIPEDPATGSASSMLAAQLAAAGALSQGANRFELMQGEDMGRPSRLLLEVDFAGEVMGDIRITGSAVRVMSGVINTG